MEREREREMVIVHPLRCAASKLRLELADSFKPFSMWLSEWVNQLAEAGADPLHGRAAPVRGVWKLRAARGTGAILDLLRASVDLTGGQGDGQRPSEAESNPVLRQLRVHILQPNSRHPESLTGNEKSSVDAGFWLGTVKNAR